MTLIHSILSKIRIQKIVMLFQKNKTIVTKFLNERISQYIVSTTVLIDIDYNFIKTFFLFKLKLND